MTNYFTNDDESKTVPAFSIIDSHTHFWNPAVLRYDWLSGSTVLNRPFLPEDYQAAMQDVSVEQVVFVEAGTNDGQSLEEAVWVAEQTGGPKIGAIVAFAPLENGPNVQEHLERLKQVEGVRGIRRNLQGEVEDLCLQSAFVKGVAMLTNFDFTFDICIRAHQLPAVTDLVKRCPGVSFVLDHAGKPDIRAGEREPWKSHLEKLARLPNVVCKLSGLATEADHAHWTENDLRFYVEHVCACFGMNRVIYGSDWPVATLATDYPRWVNVLNRLTAFCLDDERRALFAENARRVYGLGRSALS